MSHNTNIGPLANYNSLLDKNLSGYFANTHMQKHLTRSGLITSDGHVTSENAYRLRMAKKEHRKHVRDLLATAIVEKALDMERMRQHEIRKRLDELYKIELVQKVRGERGKKDGEELIALLSPRNTSKPKHRKSKSAAATSMKKESTRLPDIHFDERTKHLYYDNTDSIYSDGSHRTVPQTNSRHKSANAKFYEPRPPTDKKKKKKKIHRGLQLAKNNLLIAHRVQLQSMAEVTMKFLGSSLNLTNDMFPSSKLSEVQVIQQHCGASTVCVFRELLPAKTVFTFVSRRHRGSPFGLTININGMKNIRVSSCCEYKHKPGNKIGGKNSQFALIAVQGAAPCYRCQVRLNLIDGNGKEEDNDQACSSDEEAAAQSFDIIVSRGGKREEKNRPVSAHATTQTALERLESVDDAEKIVEKNEYEDDEFEDEDREFALKEDPASSSESSSSESDDAEDERHDDDRRETMQKEAIIDVEGDYEDVNNDYEKRRESDGESTSSHSDSESEKETEEDSGVEEKGKHDGDSDKEVNKKQLSSDESRVSSDNEGGKEEHDGDEIIDNDTRKSSLSTASGSDGEKSSATEDVATNGEEKEDPVSHVAFLEEPHDDVINHEVLEGESKDDSDNESVISKSSSVSSASSTSSENEDREEESTKEIEDTGKRTPTAVDNLSDADMLERDEEEREHPTEVVGVGHAEAEEYNRAPSIISRESTTLTGNENGDYDEEQNTIKFNEEVDVVTYEKVDLDSNLELTQRSDGDLSSEDEDDDDYDLRTRLELVSLANFGVDVTDNDDAGSDVGADLEIDPKDAADDEDKNDIKLDEDHDENMFESSDSESENDLDKGHDPEEHFYNNHKNGHNVVMQARELKDGCVEDFIYSWKDVELSNAILSPKQTEEFLRLLKERSQDLESISLKNSLLSGGILKLKEILKHAKNLKMLNLNLTNLTGADAEHIADLLSNENSLMRHLTLRGNPIGDKGIQQIVWALQNNFSNTLTTLDVGDCQLTNEGIACVATYLQTNPRLTELVINGNAVSFEGWKSIGSALRVNKTLKTLSVDNSNLNGDCLRVLLAAISENQGLVSLDIEGNDINDDEGILLYKTLQECSTLKDITLMPNNNFSKDFIDKIRSFMQNRIEGQHGV